MRRSPIQIDFQIDDPCASDVDDELLSETAQAVLGVADIRGPTELTIVITTDERVHQLNQTYRDVDATTDVLAFGDAKEETFVMAPGVPRYLGDVIIAYPRAVEQAQSAGHSTVAELQLLLVHGVLHLLGFDHAEEQDKERMWSAQASILSDLQVPVVNPTPEDVD